MAGSVPIIPRMRFTDPATGKSLVGGTLTVYLAGTTTLVTTYQDNLLTTANTNPITLDANGECLIFTDPNKRLKFLLKDSTGATIPGWPVDNIPGGVDLASSEEALRMYPGIYTSNPTTRPDGSPIQAGDIHFKSSAMYVYMGGAWQIQATVAASDLESLLLTPSSLYEALADPVLPLPAFVEGWAHNSWHSANFLAPTAVGIPLDSVGYLQLEYTVSGAAGASSLTISAGDLSKGTGQWGAVLQHDDGTWGMYAVSNVAAGACTIWPNLRATTTAKTLRNTGSANQGQHFTEPAYKALARMIYGTTRTSAYRNRYAARWQSAFGVKEDWTAVGGLLDSQKNMVLTNLMIQNTANRAYGTLSTRGRQVLQAKAAAPFTGKGVTKTFALGGSTGFLEMFISCANLNGDANGGYYPFNVTVVVDAVTLHNTNYTENHGLQRIVVPYTNGTSGTITVKRIDETGDFHVALHVGDVTWWEYDRTPYQWAWTDSVIDKNAKTVVWGDSWSALYSNVLGGELQAAMTAAGGTGVVVNVATGGDTAENGLEDWALVAAQNPAQVVIEFFTNDQSAYGADGYARWLTTLYKMGRKCQAIGARPIFVMPLPTQALGQTINHGIWAERLGDGLASV